MRKSPVVIAATVAGMAGVLGFHTTTTTVSVSIPGSTSSSATGSAGTGSARSTARPAKSGTGSSGTGSSGTGSSGTGSSGTTSAPSTTVPHHATATTTGAVRSAVGPVEQYGYGQLAVRVTVTGRKITNVSLASIQVAESYSASLAQQVIPMLRSEVLNAQSANINGISGASYTVAAYAASLQAALNKLHV